MDPTFVQVLVGLITNAFSSVVQKSWADATDLDLDDLIERTVEELVACEAEQAPALQRSTDFLLSPEVTTLVRMLFVARVHRSSQTTKELRSTFNLIHRRYEPEVTEKESRGLFDLIAAATETSLEEAVKAGDPEAEEALRASRFRRLEEEIRGLRRSIESLATTPEEDIESYLEWERI